MPPKQAHKKAAGASSKSKELITTGPKEIVVKKHHGKKLDANGMLPTTSRALILRNGKQGAMGSGEMVLSQKISGREKLELLAEDLLERYQVAIAPTFNSEKALKIAEGQFIANLDEIQDLQDPEALGDIIKAEIDARRPPGNYSKKHPDPTANPDFVGRTVANRVHNTYMVASAWRYVGMALEGVADELGKDDRIKDKLKKDPYFRGRYLELCDHANKLVDAIQSKFALLATTAKHWDQYFKKNDLVAKNEPEYIFDWSAIKSVHKSFLDSIVVELCLPKSPMRKQVLLHILHEAIDECPRDAKRFPQALWDAMGDFSETVEFMELIDSPLLGPEGDAWKKEYREHPPPKAEEFEAWADAQLFSLQAVEEYPKFKEMIYPLAETQNPNVVKDLWKFINLNYEAVCGKTIDKLWGLDDVTHRKPSWHAKQSLLPKKQDNGNDGDEPKPLVPYKGKKAASSSRKPALQITDGNDSDGSMPSLQTVSDSSSDEDYDSEDDYESVEEDESDEDDDEDYDEEEEDRMREYLREAMDIVAADPDYRDPRSQAPEFEEMAQEKKGNPFLKLLGHLRGRMFPGNATMKTADRESPRHPYSGPRPAASAYRRIPSGAPKAKPSGAPPKAKPATQTPGTHKTTVEEVSDEEEAPTEKKKKKKKPKKKKKKSTAPGDNVPILTAINEENGQAAPASEPIVTSPTSPTVPAPATPTKAKQQPSTPKPKTSPGAVPPYASTASLPTYTEGQAGQSARTYLQSEGLANARIKVKTRRENADRPSEKKSIFARWGKRQADGEEPAEAEPEPELPRGDKHSFFSKLTKKTKNYMHTLLQPTNEQLGPLKWEAFLKVMREMGFSYDPSTAGSSVRFTPPNPADPSITFHRPHPDPTLYPYKIREFGRRLKRTYGWSEQDFYRAAAMG